MTEAFDVEQSHGVRVDQLEPGDHVIMFGRAVRIVATELSDAGTGRVVLRSRGGRGDLDATLSDGWPLVAVDCPRIVTLRCLLCHTPVRAVINLARQTGSPVALCSSCQAPAADGPHGRDGPDRGIPIAEVCQCVIGHCFLSGCADLVSPVVLGLGDRARVRRRYSPSSARRRVAWWSASSCRAGCAGAGWLRGGFRCAVIRKP
jgi:hypothetical protein